MNNRDEKKNASDWRLYATTLARPLLRPDPSQPPYPEGTVVRFPSLIQVGKKTQVMPLPNASSLHLSIAIKMRDIATYHLNKLQLENREPEGPETEFYRVDQGDETELFDCLESMMGCVVFSYTALEAFANEWIPLDYVFQQERPDKRCTEIYSQQQIERFVDLQTKLSEILPRAFEVNPPDRSCNPWQDFILLERLRHRIVHTKASEYEAMKEEMKSGGSGENMFSDLLKPKTLKYPECARLVMAHYFPNNRFPDGPPRWLELCPL